MSSHAFRPSDSDETHNPSRADSPSGPFASPEINAALTESFGQSLDGIQIERGAGESAHAIDAHAYTMGNTISLGDNVREDMSDARSMEIISHEVAHALGSSSNSGTRTLDGGRDSAGESAAHAASGSFRDFVAGGAKSPAPKLSAATGGDAMIHRFEAGEHADAVDHAADTMKLDPNDPRRKLAEQKIMLGTGKNAVEVSQGEITAMMGDFYGAYTTGADGKEHFDPLASFQAMQNAPKEEKEAILAKIREEQKKVTDQKNGGKQFEASDNADLEGITNDRHLTNTTTVDPVTGETKTTKTGYTFMDLAQKNTNHFNGPNEKNADGSYNPDNNMGSYAILHQAAMQAAQKAANAAPGSPEAEAAKQEALALEASSQHFETDRFSAGHQFDKAQLIADNGGGKMANIKARVEHDKYNEEGTMVHSANPDEDPWFAKGDSHWADKDNEPNRLKAAKATMGSYGDINDILTGEKKAADMDPTKTANSQVPQWDPAFNDKVQKEGKDAITPGSLWDQKGEVGLLPKMLESGIKGKLHEWEDEEGVNDVWSMAKSKGGKALDWAEKKGSEGLDWAEKKGSEGLDWAEKKGSEGLDWAEKKGSEGRKWVEKKGGEALDAGGKAVDWAEKKGGQAVDWTGEKVSEAGTAISNGAGKAWDATTGAASDAGTWAGEKAEAAKKAFGHLFDW